MALSQARRRTTELSRPIVRALLPDQPETSTMVWSFSAKSFRSKPRLEGGGRIPPRSIDNQPDERRLFGPVHTGPKSL